jgi:valyl-tRNA synthetase
VALRTAVSTLLRLFAPFLPYVTEEVWSWCQTADGALPGFEGASVHRAPWPDAGALRAAAVDASSADGIPSPLAVAADVLGRIRKAKSDGKVSMRAAVERVTVTDTPDRLAALRLAVGDVEAAGTVDAFELVERADATEPHIEVVLAPPAEA